MGVKSKVFDAGAGLQNGEKRGVRVKLTEAERKKVEKLIREAKSLQDIIRLERELNEGRVPAEAQGDDE